MPPIRILAPSEHALYREHLLRLSPTDRRLRFGWAVDESGIDSYIAGLSSRSHRVLAHFGRGMRIIGAIHIAFCGDAIVEFGLSVAAGHRGRGIGAAMFARAVMFARNRGARLACIYFFPENSETRRLAGRAGVEIVTTNGETRGSLRLAMASPFTLVSEMLSEQAGLCDYGIKAYRRNAWPG